MRSRVPAVNGKERSDFRSQASQCGSRSLGRIGQSESLGLAEPGTIPASIASDTTDPAETADRGAAGFEGTLPCAPQLNPSLHAPTGTRAHHNTSGPGRRSETHEASPDSVRHRCLNILLALANPRCARALAALRHLAGARTPWQDPEVERGGRAGDKRRRPKGLRRSRADHYALTIR